MRISAIVTTVFSLVALILAFLCLFAGSKEGFMEEYSIVTLNTSRIGQNLFNTTESSENPFLNLIDNITNSIESSLQDGISSLAQDLGLHDFYSVHLMTYCEGYYTPIAVPNATIKKSGIERNVTGCTNRTTLFNFDPKEVLQKELDEAGLDGGVDLVEDLGWSEGIDRGFDALRLTAKAMFVLYCIAIGFVFLALIGAVIGVFWGGRMFVVGNVVVDWLGFVMIGIASTLATAVGVKGAEVINEYGNEIGIAASKGWRFLVLTWVATGLMFGASFVWCFAFFKGRKGGPRVGPKNG